MTEQTKPRFILIDPSAIHTGGHHYEYAARILKIAAQRGYAPELWANKSSDLPQDDFPVKNLLRNSFYANFGGVSGMGILKKLQSPASWYGMLQGLRARISNRLLPFFLETRAGLDASRAWHDARWGSYRPVYYGPQNKLKTSVLSYSFYFMAFKVIGVIKRILQKRIVKKAILGLIILLLILLVPLELIAGMFLAAFLLVKLQRKPAERIFADDLAKGIKGSGPWSPSDIVFIPTSFSVEIKGLGLFLNEATSMPLPQFHLLFRTNVFTGFEENHRNQIDGWLDYRQAFRWLRQAFPQAAVFHYTDTPQLSAQYKVLADEEFGVLPVPVPWMPHSVERPKGQPLTILYIGDVRDEKGYQHYPRIIENLWDEYIASDKIRFVMQSNFADNPDVCRESRMAQTALRGYPERVVRHVPGPMSSQAYKDLIDQADIVLITYKPEHYMARSSGIFIEAMKAGKAVLMPGMTWMASEIEPLRQARWREGLNAVPPIATLQKSAWPVGAFYTLPQTVTGYVAVEFTFGPQPHTGFVHLEAHLQNRFGALSDRLSGMAQIGKDGKAIVMLPLKDMTLDQIGYRTQGVSASLISAVVYASDTKWVGPAGYAAALYADQDPVSMSQTLGELIDNIDAYKKDAADFAQKRGAYFTPETLVDDVIAQAAARKATL